jgi:hypothetical protein
MIRVGAWVALALTCATAALGAPAPTEAQKEQVRNLYAPSRVEFASLAPDGQHVAFVTLEQRGGELRIFNTTDSSRKVTIRPDSDPTPVFFLGWADANRLIVVTGLQITVVDPRNGRTRKLADPAVFQRAVKTGQKARARVIGLSAGASPMLLAEVEITSYETTSIELHRVDLATGAHERAFKRELPRPGGSLVTDRAGNVRLVFSGGENPQRFSYYAQPASGDGRNLDEVLPDRAEFAFAVRPENFLEERTIPLGFGADPNVLYFASNLGRDAYGLRAVDLATGQPTGWLAEAPGIDLVELNAPWVGSPLVFDRTTGALAGARFVGPVNVMRWLDPKVAALQAALERDFPGREVNLVDWDDARERVLALVSAPGDPGRYFVRDARSGHNTEYLRNAVELDPELANAAEPFAFDADSGRVQGWLTWPRTPRTDPPPVVVWFHDGPLRRGPSRDGRNAAALATLGFAVIELNYAGASGEGRGRRAALRDGYDTVPVAEAGAALEWLAGHRPFARGQVAVVGEGYGGYLAMRAVQLQPDTYRAAVAINAPTDLAEFWEIRAAGQVTGSSSGEPGPERLGFGSTLEDADNWWESWRNKVMAAPTDATLDFHREFIEWYVENGRPLKEVAVTPQADRLVRPLFLLADPANPRAPFASTNELRRELRRLKRPPEYQELKSRLTRAELIEQVAAFLAKHLDAPKGKKAVAP